MANNTRTINTIRSSTHYHTLSAPKHIDIAHFTPELGRKNETDANTVLAYVPFFFSAWHNHAGRMCCAAATIYSVINKSNESKYLWMRWIIFVYNKLETCMGTCSKKNQATIWSANIRWQYRLTSEFASASCMHVYSNVSVHSSMCHPDWFDPLWASNSFPKHELAKLVTRSHDDWYSRYCVVWWAQKISDSNRRIILFNTLALIQYLS